MTTEESKDPKGSEEPKKRKKNKKALKKQFSDLRAVIVRGWFRHQSWVFILVLIGACSYAVWQWYQFFYVIELGSQYYEDVVISQQGIDLNEGDFDDVIQEVNERAGRFGDNLEVKRDIFYK